MRCSILCFFQSLISLNILEVMSHGDSGDQTLSLVVDHGRGEERSGLFADRGPAHHTMKSISTTFIYRHKRSLSTTKRQVNVYTDLPQHLHQSNDSLLFPFMSPHQSLHHRLPPLPPKPVTLEGPPPVDSFYMCDHPPVTYSQSFLGHVERSCSGEAFTFDFVNTETLCNEVYLMLHPDGEVRQDTLETVNGNVSFILYYGERYLRVCVPLYRLFSRCEERKYHVICWEAGVVFVNLNTCQYAQKSGPYFSLHFFDIIVNKNSSHDALTMLCEGICQIEEKEVAGVPVRISGIDNYYNNKTCSSGSEPRINTEQNTTIYKVFNTHWPCCYPHYKVLWLRDPRSEGLNPNWSYLSVSCQIGEVVLVVVVACVAVGGLTGNLLVLVVMAAGGHRNQESNILRTSLAVADLLTTVFTVCPSLYRHIQPFISTDLPFEWKDDIVEYLEGTHPSENVTVVMKGVIHLSNKIFLFQGLLFTTSSLVSLLTLALLSFERLVLTTESLSYTRVFSVQKVLFLIAFTWIGSIFAALVISYDNTGLAANYVSMLKLTVGMSEYHNDSKAFQIFYYTHLAVIALVAVTTITLSIIAIRNFVVEEARVMAEWKSLNMRVTGPRKQENRYIVTTQLLMTSLFLLAIFPQGLFFMWTSLSKTWHQRDSFDILHYISWWLFLGGCAWNPWVYNMRGKQFRQDALVTLRKLLSWITRSHAPQ